MVKLDNSSTCVFHTTVRYTTGHCCVLRFRFFRNRRACHSSLFLLVKFFHVNSDSRKKLEERKEDTVLPRQCRRLELSSQMTENTGEVISISF